MSIWCRPIFKFRGTADDEYYRLVRSYTPTGVVVDEIPTIRPTMIQGPASTIAYYVISRRLSTRIICHYEWSDTRLHRYRELYIDPDYRVVTVPGYEAPTTANPFKVFETIPSRSRYQFLLDDAHFFIEGLRSAVARSLSTSSRISFGSSSSNPMRTA